MNCIFCKEKMYANRYSKDFSCLKCKINYSNNYYYGQADKNGLTTKIDKNFLIIHILGFNKVLIFSHYKKIYLTYHVENLTLECLNSLVKKVFKMEHYV